MSPRKKSLRYDTSRPLFDVYHGDYLVGHLGQHGGDAWFQYAPAVAEDAEPQRYRLSVRLPVRAEVYETEATLAFFDNLLLESDTRTVLARAAHRDSTDVAGLLGVIGGECAGAVSVWPHGASPPAHAAYRAYTPGELRHLFDAAHGEQLTQAQLDSRQSMSGVQDKLVFRRGPAGYDLPLDGAPGDVILKRPSPRYPGLVENEHACQRLLGALGLPAAPSRALTGELYLLESTRYDRRPDGHGGLRRIHQEDFCQATGRLPRHKYQRHYGPSFADVATVLRRYSLAAYEDLEYLVRAAAANLCVGNMDAHAKNFSLLYLGESPRLAPFYDVVCTAVYPSLDRSYSMYFGGAAGPHELSPRAVERFARDIGFTPAKVREAIGDTTTALLEAWPGVLHAASQETGQAPIYDAMDRVIRTETARVRQVAVTPAARAR